MIRQPWALQERVQPAKRLALDRIIFGYSEVALTTLAMHFVREERFNEGAPITGASHLPMRKPVGAAPADYFTFALTAPTHRR